MLCSLLLQVSYTDGTVEQYWLGTERVRVQYYPGEQMPTPDGDTLHHLAQKYQQQAEVLEQQQQQEQPQKDCAAAVPTVDDEVMLVQGITGATMQQSGRRQLLHPALVLWRCFDTDNA